MAGGDGKSRQGSSGGPGRRKGARAAATRQTTTTTGGGGEQLVAHRRSSGSAQAQRSRAAQRSTNGADLPVMGNRNRCAPMRRARSVRTHPKGGGATAAAAAAATVAAGSGGDRAGLVVFGVRLVVDPAALRSSQQSGQMGGRQRSTWRWNNEATKNDLPVARCCNHCTSAAVVAAVGAGMVAVVVAVVAVVR